MIVKRLLVKRYHIWQATHFVPHTESMISTSYSKTKGGAYWWIGTNLVQAQDVHRGSVDSRQVSELHGNVIEASS